MFGKRKQFLEKSPLAGRSSSLACHQQSCCQCCPAENRSQCAVQCRSFCSFNPRAPHAHKLCSQMSGTDRDGLSVLGARAKLSLHLSDDGVVGEYFNPLIPTCRHPKLYAKGHSVDDSPLFASSHHRLLCSSQRIHKSYSRFCPGTKPSPSSRNQRRDSHET